MNRGQILGSNAWSTALAMSCTAPLLWLLWVEVGWLVGMLVGYISYILYDIYNS